MTYLLALDQGTTSSRAILFSPDGAPIATAQKEFPQIFPRPGWVEHDPADIWQSQLSVAAEVLAKAAIAPVDIAAIGITNQRETTLLWDRKTGQPIHNAIVWQDRRTAPFCDELKNAGHAQSIQQKTGLVIDAYFSATKIRWLLQNVPGAMDRAQKGQLAFGTVDSWLLWNLTSGGVGGGSAIHATDPSNASRTMLYNIHENKWDDDLLQLFNIPREILPEVKPSSSIFGETRLLGSQPLKIAGIAGDQQAALFGQACFSPGLAKNTYGTGCFMLMNTGQKPVASQHKLLSTIAWSLPQSKIENQKSQITYALEGSVFIAGALVQWLRDGLGLIKSAADIEPLAKSVPDNGGVYLVPAFTGLGAAHWDPYARGTILGITRGTTAAHFARAALEAIALQSADLLDLMANDSQTPLQQLRVDGGASANNLLMQIQADLLNLPVVRPKTTETTALGAAYLAGLAVNLYKSPNDLAQNWTPDRTFTPQRSRDEIQSIKHHWQKALARSRNWEQP